jgi:hypothetical protein
VRAVAAERAGFERHAARLRALHERVERTLAAREADRSTAVRLGA